LLATSKNFPTHKIYTHVFTKNYFTDDKIRQAQGDQIGGIRLLGGTLLWVVFQILKKERIFFGIPFLNEPVMYHFVHFLTKNGLGDFLETFWQLFGDFLATFWRLFGDFLATFWRLFGDFLATFWRLFHKLFWSPCSCFPLLFTFPFCVREKIIISVKTR
jgi:hypothetical protein